MVPEARIELAISGLSDQRLPTRLPGHGALDRTRTCNRPGRNRVHDPSVLREQSIELQDLSTNFQRGGPCAVDGSSRIRPRTSRPLAASDSKGTCPCEIERWSPPCRHQHGRTPIPRGQSPRSRHRGEPSSSRGARISSPRYVWPGVVLLSRGGGPRSWHTTPERSLSDTTCTEFEARPSLLGSFRSQTAASFSCIVHIPS